MQPEDPSKSEEGSTDQLLDESVGTQEDEATSNEQESDEAHVRFNTVVTERFVVNEVHEMHYDDDRLVALRLHEKTVLRTKEIFYPSPRYKESLIQAFQSNERVLIVHGPEHSGKLTCGIKLACDLRGKNGHETPIYLYRRRSDETRSLFEAVQSEQIPVSATLILEDAFTTNIALRDLQPPEVDSLRGAALEKDLVLILTTELDIRELHSLGGAKVSTKGLHLDKVLTKHLKSAQLQTAGLISEDLVTRILGRWPDLKIALRSPSQIERFCGKVSEHPPREDSEIDRLARQAALVGQRALREWFSRLGSDEKLFAMLAYLFAGTERSILEDMHSASIRMLRAEGLSTIRDSRELGFEDLLDSIQAQELGGFVEFKDESLAEEVGQQLSSWGQLLWFVINGLLTSASPEASPEIRRALGVALGRLANPKPRIDEVIEDLASQRSTKIAVIAGSALEERVRRNLEVQGPLTVKRLRDWAQSGEPERMWAAGAAARRVYSATKGVSPELKEEATALQEELMGILGQLVKRSESFVRGCAADSVKRICLMDPSKSYILGEWLQEKATKEVARDIAIEVFEALTNPRFRPVETKHSTFLTLIKPILEATGQGKNDALFIDSLFGVIASWLKWGEWHNPVFIALLDVANRGSEGARQRLRSALSRYWLEGETQTRKIGQAVIARSYSMDGILMDGPQFGKGALVIDPAFLKAEDAETKAQKIRACHHLLGVLDSHVNAELVYLGAHCAPLGSSTSPHSPFPQLLMPALKEAGLQDPRLVLVLSHGVILDLEDALDQPWGKNLLLITTDAVTTTQGLDIIQIHEDFRSTDLSKVEGRLHAKWAEALALSGPESWMETLESFGTDPNLFFDPVTTLDTQVSGLSETESATGHDDLARRLLCMICWHASSDLLQCAEHLASWIAERAGSDYRHNSMGVAGAKALFRIHEAHCPSLNNPAPRILFETLAYPLAEQGEDGVNTVLHAVRRWLQDPLWAAYLAGEVENGKGRLLRWAEKLAPQHVQGLKTALPKTPEIPSGIADDVREELSALLDRIRLSIARERPKALPPLADGESYALLVLDASEPDIQSRNNLAKLARGLFARLSRPTAHRIKPIVYRLGERQPCWISGDPTPPAEMLLPKQPDSPCLLGPILSNELPLEAVRFLILLSNRFPLDGDDWVETDWRKRIFLWKLSSVGKGHPAFASFPDFADPSIDLSIKKILLTCTPRYEDAQF